MYLREWYHVDVVYADGSEDNFRYINQEEVEALLSYLLAVHPDAIINVYTNEDLLAANA